MRPVEPNYQEQCQELLKGEELRKLLPNLKEEKCIALLQRGTRRCHAMARRYLLERALEDHIEHALKTIDEYVSELATTLSLIEMGAYRYSINGDSMFESLIKGYSPTWECVESSHDYSHLPILVDNKKVEYHGHIEVRFHDAVMREWFVSFYIDPGLMTYRQYKRWVKVYQKWQDKALTAIAARTL